MSGLEEAEVQCPWCWEVIVLEVDLSAGPARYPEDCPVCCQPLSVTLRIGGDSDYVVEVEREN
jgi:hypothetical protein